MKLINLVVCSLVLSFGSLALATSARRLTVSAVGDIMMGTNYPSDQLRSDGGRRLFDHSRAYFEASDIAFANLEGPLFDGEKDDSGKAEGSNRYLFRTPTSYAQWLKDAGIDVVSLANNHALDFGVSGLISSKTALHSVGIQYSSKKQNEIAEFSVNGLRVALLAVDYYPGARSLSTPRQTLQEIRALKEHFDIVIVSAHAGGEGASAERMPAGEEVFLGENRGDPVRFAHSAVDAGAGLVLMHGPHVVRAMELYQEHLIVYSLGNFITERGIGIQGLQGLAPFLRVLLDDQGRLLSGEITSYRQTREQGTIYDPSGAAFKRIRALTELDFPETMIQFESEKGRFFPKR